MLDERERVEQPELEALGLEPSHPPAASAYSQWLESLSVDELLQVFSDPHTGGSWNEDLRAEMLELIRQKGGESAVRRALGMHMDRPDARAARPEPTIDPDPWQGSEAARPGVLRALGSVGRAWVEAALAHWWAELPPAAGEPPVDLCAALREAWPELVPALPPPGAPGATIDMVGPRMPLAPEQRRLRLIEAAGAIIGAGSPMVPVVTLFGRAELSDGGVAPLLATSEGGLTADSPGQALDAVASLGCWVGGLSRLSLMTRPLIAQPGEEDGLLVGRSPLGGLPDPIRPGPLWVALGLPSPHVALRAHLGPALTSGLSGVLNRGRALAFLSRLSNLGYLPGGDPAARLPAPAPIVGESLIGGARVTFTRRPGDARSAASLAGTTEAVAQARATLLEGADDAGRRAAALTAPAGPVPVAGAG